MSLDLDRFLAIKDRDLDRQKLVKAFYFVPYFFLF